MYAVGIVFWTMQFKKRPKTHTDALETLHKHSSKLPDYMK